MRHNTRTDSTSFGSPVPDINRTDIHARCYRCRKHRIKIFSCSVQYPRVAHDSCSALVQPPGHQGITRVPAVLPAMLCGSVGARCALSALIRDYC